MKTLNEIRTLRCADKRYILMQPHIAYMGILDFFSKKNTYGDDILKRDILEMKATLGKLSEKVRVNDKNIETVYEAMDEMLKTIEKNSLDIAAVSKSAAEGPDGTRKDQDLLSLKAELSSMGADLLEMKKKIIEIMKISKLAIQNYDDIREIKQKTLLRNRSTPENAPQDVEIQKTAEFSAKESRVLNALLNSEIPLTYEEVAVQVNISPITVKGYINSIKKIRPDIILENTKGRGRKAYSIKSEYRIKVLSGRR